MGARKKALEKRGSLSDDGPHLQIDEEESEFAKGWLQWCRAHRSVKCTDVDVPDGILPPSYTGVLTDVKVGGGYGPDDKIYGNNPDLRQKVARGNSVLELRKKGSRNPQYVFMVFALKKFSGGMGDEDDSPGYQNAWESYFLQGIENAENVICTRKANGEAAHVSSRRLFGENYFCLGSKNVHLLVKTKEDMNKYQGSRYEVAKVVGETFFRSIIESGNVKVEELLHLIQHETCTMVFEILQPGYQHVENLSHLPAPELQFICWTSYKAIEEEDTLCTKPPNIAIDQARQLGLSTVDYEIINANEAEEYMQKVRSDFGYEGRVLYFVDKENNVIGLLKKKTSWYIILRAIREKVCQAISVKNSITIAEHQKKIKTRILTIQTWIGFSDEYRDRWTMLGIEFLKWVKATKFINVRSQFPVLWKSFLDSNVEMNVLYNSIADNYS